MVCVKKYAKPSSRVIKRPRACGIPNVFCDKRLLNADLIAACIILSLWLSGSSSFSELFSRNELKKSKFLPLISAKVAFKTAMHDKIYLGHFGGNNISRATVVFSTAFGSRLILLLAQGLGLMPLMSVQFTFKVCCLSVSRMEMCLVILLMNLSSVYAFNSNYNPGIFIKSNYIESTLFIICKMLVFILQIGKYEDLLTC